MLWLRRRRQSRDRDRDDPHPRAPHAHRTLFAIVAGLPEHKIRIISPDIEGGFGNKVPIYPGYVVATAASLLIGRPVKWVETARATSSLMDSMTTTCAENWP